MIRSMTGFAAAEGRYEMFRWSWELRAVNGRGLDLRLRVPDWIDGLEMALRKRLGAAMARGSVTLNLRLTREDASGGLQLNRDALAAVLDALGAVEEEAMARGQTLAQANGVDILSLRGLLDQGDATSRPEEIAALRDALLADIDPVIAAFLDMRETEGRALNTIVTHHLDEIARLTRAAAEAAEARRPAADDAFRAALARVTANAGDVAEDRIAQELALLAVKADVTEEINRLDAHIEAARALLDKGGAVGRRFDFLLQEFNREANTLCSKSGDQTLTAIGLDLKTAIDQLREQIQNVE